MPFDVKSLELVGEGHHGKVYRLDHKRCVKIYREKAFLQMEYQVLQHSQGFAYYPKVYECKEDYMVREYFDGPNLWEYIQDYGINANIATQILEVIDSFVLLRFSKIDCHLHHLIVTEGERLKMIDPTTNMTRRTSYPRKLLQQLEQLGLKEQFLNYTKEFRPDYYEQWLDK